MNNKDKIATFNFMRKQTIKSSGFPPVSGSLMQDGFNTSTNLGENILMEPKNNGIVFAPGTA